VREKPLLNDPRNIVCRSRAVDEARDALQPIIEKVWRHCEATGTLGRTVTLNILPGTMLHFSAKRLGLNARASAAGFLAYHPKRAQRFTLEKFAIGKKVKRRRLKRRGHATLLSFVLRPTGIPEFFWCRSY
jgi:hypothetical protein